MYILFQNYKHELMDETDFTDFKSKFSGCVHETVILTKILQLE